MLSLSESAPLRTSLKEEIDKQDREFRYSLGISDPHPWRGLLIETMERAFGSNVLCDCIQGQPFYDRSNVKQTEQVAELGHILSIAGTEDMPWPPAREYKMTPMARDMWQALLPRRTQIKETPLGLSMPIHGDKPDGEWKTEDSTADAFLCDKLIELGMSVRIARCIRKLFCDQLAAGKFNETEAWYSAAHHCHAFRRLVSEQLDDKS